MPQGRAELRRGGVRARDVQLKHHRLHIPSSRAYPGKHMPEHCQFSQSAIAQGAIPSSRNHRDTRHRQLPDYKSVPAIFTLAWCPQTISAGETGNRHRRSSGEESAATQLSCDRRVASQTSSVTDDSSGEQISLLDLQPNGICHIRHYQRSWTREDRQLALGDLICSRAAKGVARSARRMLTRAQDRLQKRQESDDNH